MINTPVQCCNVLICLALDVCGFGQLKQAIRKIKVKRTYENGDHISKANILDIITPAYKDAFTPSNIKAGFCATGIHPFNPAVITAEKLAPSKATTNSNPFPGATPLVIRKTVDLIMPQLASPETPCSRPAPPQFDAESPLHQSRDQQTPISGAAVLRDTEIGFIYQTNDITSSQELPPQYSNYQSPLKPLNLPRATGCSTVAELKEENQQLQAEIDHLQRKFKRCLRSNRNLNAQVSIQHSFLSRYCYQLALKEQRRKANRNKINPNGRGVILTSEET